MCTAVACNFKFAVSFIQIGLRELRQLTQPTEEAKRRGDPEELYMYVLELFTDQQHQLAELCAAP